MKKRFHIITLLSLLIVCGLLNLILFLTIPDARLSEGVFWMAWAFAFPFFLTVAILSTWLVGGKANRMLGKHASVLHSNRAAQEDNQIPKDRGGDDRACRPLLQ